MHKPLIQNIKADELIEFFHSACREIFSIQFNLLLEISDEIITQENLPAEISITSSVGLTSVDFSGSASLAFSKEVFLKIVEQMLGEAYSEINEENSDLACEILNMIFGHMKAKYHQASKKQIQPAIPVVAYAPNIKMHMAKGQEVSLVKIKSKLGEFYASMGVSAVEL